MRRPHAAEFSFEDTHARSSFRGGVHRLFTTAAGALTPPAPSRSPFGYAETQINANRVRVTFAGDTSTPHETVETYLLFRAAETTFAPLRPFHCG
jgi:hypothetical protein